MHAGPHVSRVHEHGRAPSVAELGRQRARQQLQRRLGRAVRPPTRIRGGRGVAGDVHDQPPPFGQQRHRELRQHHRRADVDWEQPAETRDVEGEQRTDRAQLRRVVDQNIQHRAAARLDQGGAYRRVGDVARDRTTRRVGDIQWRLPQGIAIAAPIPGGINCAQDAGNHQPPDPMLPVTRESIDSVVKRHLIPSRFEAATSSELEVKQKERKLVPGVMCCRLRSGGAQRVAPTRCAFTRNRDYCEGGRSGHGAIAPPCCGALHSGVRAEVGLSIEEIRVELEKLPRNRDQAETNGPLSDRWAGRIDERIRPARTDEIGLTECSGAEPVARRCGSQSGPPARPGAAPAAHWIESR